MIKKLRRQQIYASSVPVWLISWTTTIFLPSYSNPQCSTLLPTAICQPKPSEGEINSHIYYLIFCRRICRSNIPPTNVNQRNDAIVALIFLISSSSSNASRLQTSKQEEVLRMTAAAARKAMVCPRASNDEAKWKHWQSEHCACRRKQFRQFHPISWKKWKWILPAAPYLPVVLLSPYNFTRFALCTLSSWWWWVR